MSGRSSQTGPTAGDWQHPSFTRTMRNEQDVIRLLGNGVKTVIVYDSKRIGRTHTSGVIAHRDSTSTELSSSMEPAARSGTTTESGCLQYEAMTAGFAQSKSQPFAMAQTV